MATKKGVTLKEVAETQEAEGAQELTGTGEGATLPLIEEGQELVPREIAPGEMLEGVEVEPEKVPPEVVEKIAEVAAPLKKSEPIGFVEFDAKLCNMGSTPKGEMKVVLGINHLDPEVGAELLRLQKNGSMIEVTLCIPQMDTKKGQQALPEGPYVACPKCGGSDTRPDGEGVWCKTCGGFVRIPEEEPEAEVAKPVYVIMWRSKADENETGIAGVDDEPFTFDDEKKAEAEAEALCAGNPEKRFWVEIDHHEVAEMTLLPTSEPAPETVEEWVIEREKGGIVPGVFGSQEAAKAAGDTLLKEHPDWGYFKIRKRAEKDKMPESPVKAEAAPAPEQKAEVEEYPFGTGEEE